MQVFLAHDEANVTHQCEDTVLLGLSLMMRNTLADFFEGCHQMWYMVHVPVFAPLKQIPCPTSQSSINDENNQIIFRV
jgi:hypothetical protein